MSQRGPVAILTVHACPFSEIGAAENGGMNVYVREVTRRLAARDMATVVFTRKEDAGAPPELQVPDGCHLVHVPAGPQLPIDKNAVFYHLPEFYRGVADYARQHQLDFSLAHSHYWLSGWVGRRLSRLWGIPWVHSAHTLGRVKNGARPPGASLEPEHRLAVEQEIVRDCHRLIAPTMAELEDLQSLYGAGRDCVAVVPLGVDTDVFRGTSSEALRRELGLDREEQVILFTGRLERLKGVEILIRAFNVVWRSEPGRRLRLLVLGADSTAGRLESRGEGGERRRLEAVAAELGVAERVSFLGTVGHDRLPEYYSLADVCCVPSYSESFGLVALEAQACGTPVVAARVGGLGQLVVDGVTGLSIPGHDARDYAVALQRLLDDAGLRDSMGAAGRRLARGYSWDATVDRLLAAYEETEHNFERAALALLG